MSCSKEEIERKRLAAIRKRQEKILSQSNHNNDSIANTFLPLKSSVGIVKSSLGGRTGFQPYAKPDSSKRSNGNSSIPITSVVTGFTYLISEDRFEVNPSEFCTPLINIFKTIHSKSYGKFYCLKSKKSKK